MNGVRTTLMVAAAIFIAVLLISPRAAGGYLRFILLLLIGTLMLAPFAWLVCASVKDNSVQNEYSFLPPVSKISSATINLDNFRQLLADQPSPDGPVSFWRYVANSLFVASTTTFVSLVFCSMGGFAITRYRFRGRGLLIAYLVASMAIPGVLLLAPNFEVIWRLGWMDTYRALIVPASVGAFGVLLFRQAMLNIPNELIEAARIDGWNEWRIYLMMVMPLVRPMSGAFCLISFLAAWNSFLTPNIYLQTQRKLTLPVVLNQYLGQYSEHYGIFLAGTLLAIIPPAILFFSLQKEFIAGLTSGAVKQ